MANQTKQKKSFWDDGGKKASVVSGRDVYQDEKGRNILYVKSSGCGYVIAAKNEREFSLYHNRYILVITAVILAVNLGASLMLCLGIGAAIAAVLEWRYRKAWLPTLTCITNFHPQKRKTMIESLVEMGNRSRCLVMGLLYFAFGILIVINGYQIGSSQTVIFFDWLVLVGAGYLGTCYLIAVLKMK